MNIRMATYDGVVPPVEDEIEEERQNATELDPPAVTRPQTTFDGASHSYTIEGEKVLGVSTVAKIGEDEVWGVASAWAWRIGYEGVHTLLKLNMTKDELREKLKRYGLSPWSKTKKAQKRGTWVHDLLEGLARTGDIPDLSKVPKEEMSHARGICNWYLDYRPEFVATEVQVASKVAGFAGRYDIRCWIEAAKLLQHKKITPDEAQLKPGPWLTLDDLKTGKRVYPTSQFVQLEGYELASVEMGFPETDARFVLNTHPDGTYDFVRSCAIPQDFLNYLAAARSIARIKAETGTTKKKGP